MDKIKKNKEIIIGPLITAAILLLVYAIKHIYPFGPRDIAYYDMNQSFVPLYTRTWDILHGKVHWLYDWYTGSGNAISGIISNFLISPFNLFFLFVKREHILESMSYFLMLKLMFSSAAMIFYTKKRYGLSCTENIAVGLIYAFCGYTVQYYTNIHFLDTLAFFPLLMYGLWLMSKREKPYLYTLMLVLMLVSGTYLSLITLIFVLFYSFFYMYIVLEKEKRKNFAAYLGLYTIIALLMSMVVVFPSILKWLSSSRLVEKESGSYLESLKVLRGYFAGNAAFMLYGSELGIAAAVVGAIKKKKPARREIFNILMLVLLIIPLFAEPVNIMWHFGSYDSFPCRYAFILTFIALDTYALFTSTQKERTHKKYAVYACVILLIICIAAALYFGIGFMQYGIYDVRLYKKYIALFIALVLLFGIALALTKRGAASAVLLSCTLCLSVILCIGFISPLRNAEYDSAQTTATMNNYIKESNALDAALEFKNDNLTKIKTVHPDLSPNFGLILERPTLSSWTNEASYGYLDQMRRFGYGITKTKILCEGGTAFTDAFLNVGAVVSRYPVNEELYEKTQSVGDFNIYKCKNVFPFGILVSKNFFITSFPVEGMKMQNLLYNNLTGTLENIFEDIKPELKNTEKVGEWDGYRCKLEIEGKKTLYARTSHENTPMAYVFYINGAAHYMPYFDAPDAYTYPREHLNGFVELGTFKDETVELVVASPDKDLEMLEIGLFDNERLEKLIKCFENSHAENVAAEKNKMSMTAEPEGECFMFLPVEYDLNWEAEVNGQKADIIPVLNNAFMAVDLPGGHCDIKMKYVPKNFYAGSAISLVGLMLLLWAAERRREKLDWTNTKVLQNGAFVCFNLTAAASFTVIYVIPLVSWMIFSVISILK